MIEGGFMMFQLIVKKYIENYDDSSHPKVRERYGTLCSILSIICNGFMVVFKLIFGFITRSVAIQADGFNNLSDMGRIWPLCLGLNWLANIQMLIILMVMEDMNILQD